MHMNHLIRQATLLVALLMASFTWPGSLHAQSVDDCMSARLTDALKLCKSILDSGSRSVDVFWKLSSAQYQDGQQALANKTLEDALKLHPGNPKLLSLQEIMSSATTEQALIARSAKLNQSSLDKGALKIACLTKTGEEAISACKRRLELSDEDGDRMRSRLSALEKLQPPAIIATAPITEGGKSDSDLLSITEPETETSTSTGTYPEERPIETIAKANSTATQESQPTTEINNEPSSETSSNAVMSDLIQQATETRRQAYKELVSVIQARLNEFGFDAGYPDGVPGKKTRTALSEFYTAIGQSANISITDLTLEDLDDEKRKFDMAEQLIRQSEQAAEQGNVQLAKQKLADAQSASKLVKVPDLLQQALFPRSTTTVAAVAVEPSSTPVPVTTNRQANQASQSQIQAPESNTTATTIARTTTGTSSQPFSELMAQIKTLQGKIRRKQEDETELLSRIRQAF